MADDKKDKAAKDKAGKKDGGAGKQGADAHKGGAPKQGGAAKQGGGGKGGKDGKESKGGKGKQAEAAAVDEVSEKLDPNYKPRLRLHYQKAVAAALTKKFSYKNPMMVPRLEKVVINMGLGAAVGNPKIIDSAV